MANAALADKTTAVAVKAMGKSCFMTGENISHDIGKKDSKSPQTTNKNYAEYGDCRIPTRIQTVQPQSEANLLANPHLKLVSPAKPNSERRP
jgi:hypothetical protein